jgi:hypothetical protein
MLINFNRKNHSIIWLIITLKITKHQSLEVGNYCSVQYNSFIKIKTPDDGRLRPKHVVRKESERVNSCIVTEVLSCVNYNGPSASIKSRVFF